MFNNFVNFSDLKRVIWGIRHGYARAIVSKLTQGKVARTRDHWKPKVKRVPAAWWESPYMQKRWNYMVTGDENIDFYQYISDKYFSERKGLKALSLGCGTGFKDLKWLKYCDFESYTAIDVSEHSISQANENARQKGLDHIISYKVADLNTMALEENFYDIILVDQSLHHFTPLDSMLDRIKRALKPEGYFVAHEFVGATRWQYPNRQLEVANAVLAILPEKYRTHVIDGKARKKIIRQSRLSMIMKDPSESVESGNIMPLLRKMFHIVEFRSYHGGVLHLLLDGIVHHFIEMDEENEKYLKICCEIEDLLTKTGELNEDFVVVICSARTPAAA